MADQVDNHIQADKRLSLPVHRNVIEQSMFDLVPLAGARREMTHMNRQATLVRKFLQTIFPEAIATAVAPATVRRDVQMFRVRINLLAQMLVPTTNRLHRELRRVMVDSHIHPTEIFLQVVNSVRRRLAEFLVDEIINLHQLRRTFWSPNLSVLPVIADQFLLFGVDGNDRTISFQKLFRLLVDEFELGVSIRIRSAFDRLAIAGKLIFQFVQQSTNLFRRNFKTVFPQSIAQFSRAFRGPTKGRHRIAFGGWFDEGVEGRQEFRLFFRRLFSSASFSSNSVRGKSFLVFEFFDSLNDGRSRKSRCSCDETHAAMPQAHCFAGRPESFLAFVPFLFQHLKLPCNDFFHECTSVEKS